MAVSWSLDTRLFLSFCSILKATLWSIMAAMLLPLCLFSRQWKEGREEEQKRWTCQLSRIPEKNAGGNPQPGLACPRCNPELISELAHCMWGELKEQTSTQCVFIQVYVPVTQVLFSATLNLNSCLLAGSNSPLWSLDSKLFSVRT